MGRTVIAFWVGLVIGLGSSANADDFFPGNPPDELLADRNALVVGVSHYAPPLRELGENPLNDAQQVHNFLQQVGFASELIEDPDRNQILGSLNRVQEKMRRRPGLLLIYFAGHGLTVNGQGYLLPRDAIAEQPRDAADRMISLDRVYDAIRAAKARDAIVIIDACRDDPFDDGGKSEFRAGFANMSSKDPPDRTYVAFSTVDGSRAENGATGNSPFTEAFLRFAKQRLDLVNLFIQVRTVLSSRNIGQPNPSRDVLVGHVKLMTTRFDYNDEGQDYSTAISSKKAGSVDYFMRLWPVGYFYNKAEQAFRFMSQEEAIKGGSISRPFNFAGSGSDINPPYLDVGGDPQKLAWYSPPTETKSAVITSAAPSTQFLVHQTADLFEFSPKRGKILAQGTPVVITGMTDNWTKVATAVGEFVVDSDKLRPVSDTSREASIWVSASDKTFELKPSVEKATQKQPKRVIVQATFAESASSDVAAAVLASGIKTVKSLEDHGTPPEHIIVAPPVRAGTVSEVKLFWVP
jgi:hypothetical protein